MRLEARDDLVHRREAVLLRLRERAQDDALHRGRNRRKRVDERRRLFGQDLRDELDGVAMRSADATAEGRMSGQELVREDAPRVLIDARVERLASHLLGRHVERRSDDDALRGERRQRSHLRRAGGIDVETHAARDAEVEHLHGAIRAHHHVLRLDVAVHETTCVRRRERARDLDEPPLSRMHGHSGIAHESAQRLPVDELHRDVRRSVDLTDVEDGDGVRMVERRRGARFAQEPRRSLRGRGRARAWACRRAVA